MGLGMRLGNQLADERFQVGVYRCGRCPQLLVASANMGRVAAESQHSAQGLGNKGPSEVLRRTDDTIDIQPGNSGIGMAPPNLIQQQGLADTAQPEQRRVAMDAEVQEAQQFIEGSKFGLAVYKQWLQWKVVDVCPRSVGRMLR